MTYALPAHHTDKAPHDAPAQINEPHTEAGAMPLETATYINQLVDTNPVDTDSEGQGGAHLRLIKATLQATFPNFTGNVTATNVQLTAAATQGGVPTGAMIHFPGGGAGLVFASGGAATGTEPWVECDGSSYTFAKFPNLGAFFGVSSGSFNVPQLKDTGRFLRSRSGSTTAGASQANQNGAHTHTVNDPTHTHAAADTGHNHGASSSSSVSDPGHVHAPPSGGAFQIEVAGPSQGLTGGANGYQASTTGASATGISVSTSTSISTGFASIAVNGAATGITLASEGGTETRPESYVTLVLIKT